MRQVQEMAVEFVNALNTAAAAESQCTKLRRMLEEERKLVQRLKQEKQEEAQIAKRKIEKLSQRLAEARKDVDSATSRADVAENEWMKVKRQLQEAQQLVQLIKPESEETRQSILKQVEEKELELAIALNAAAIAESECHKLRMMLEEERKLVQRIKRKKDEEEQLAKRQIEEIGQELDDAKKSAESATTRADVGENEWIKAKRELQEEREHSQLLKLECVEIRQSAVRQVEEKELPLHATEIAERECVKLRRMLEEEQKLVQSLRLEKDDELILAKRQLEEIDQELANARKDAELAQKDAELARKDADVVENEWIKVKRDLREKEELVKLLELKCQEVRESSMRQDEEKARELANALNASAIAESECAKMKRMLIEEGKTVQRLIIEKDDQVDLAERQIEKTSQELADARKEAEYARKDANIAKNEWIKVKRELKEKEELVKWLKLEILEIGQGTITQVEEVSQELANARKEAVYARKDSDIAKNEWIKVKKELQEKLELVQFLKLECQETRQSAKRQVEEKELELADALNAAAIAQSSSAAAESECARLRRMLIEEGKTVQRLILEKDDKAELARRQIEELSQELDNVLNAPATAESSSAAQDCAICLTNEKDMAFGCGHMTCEDCGMMLSMCPICREAITHRIKLFPG